MIRRTSSQSLRINSKQENQKAKTQSHLPKQGTKYAISLLTVFSSHLSLIFPEPPASSSEPQHFPRASPRALFHPASPVYWLTEITLELCGQADLWRPFRPVAGDHFSITGLTAGRPRSCKGKQSFVIKIARNRGFPGDSVVKSSLPMQETRVQSLIEEDLTCCRATKPVHQNY